MAKKAKRPRDTNQLAKLIGDIATGQKVDAISEDKRNPAAVALGKLGGAARAKSLSPTKRKKIAKKAAKARWKGKPGGSDGAGAPAR
ncbi:MAG: histone H1 [Flavobacteriales bacterium]|nr:MAG: histone H1 [Flavobacteriales bacterium]